MKRFILAFVVLVACIPTASAAVFSGKLVASCAHVSRVGTSRIAYVAVTRGRIVAYRSPGSHPFTSFRKWNVNGVRTALAIRQVVYDRACEPAWFRAQLPRRPNGSLGYVRASAVLVGSVRTRLEVDLSARRLIWFRNGRARLRFPVSIGSRSTPTPTGRYYVNQRIIAADPTGPYGPSALGISAFSPVLTGWIQGGPIAVHGTNRPDLIGQAVSTGCVRVRNDVMRRLFPITPVGTPVVIHP